ncbi:MAG: phospholipid carrier-dependent glycosyltransferase [Candidatus Bathyarchaeota archaeon]|nr:phospholipid carrier-dependent glycosyltransferase [Candidatus Bathyarchaeota archaeon]
MRLDKKDAAIIATISVLFFIVAAYNVGLTRIPSTTWGIKQETLYLTLDANKTIDTIYLFVNTDANATASFSIPRGTGWVDKAWVNDHEYYKWLRVEFRETTDRIRIHFYLPAGDVLEVAVVASDGTQIGIKSIISDAPGDAAIQHLVDEQSLFENPPTFRSETMFDEELFVRASQQYLSGVEPTAEATHPPLGKLIIAAGIALFGFAPFGWRIFGVVFAALMIPIVYALGFALFKTRAAATIAASLVALDFMHFAMSRVGTVDTYLIFFILLSTLFFYLNFEKMAGGSKPDYRLIIAGLVSFSLAFSVKWIAIFGLVGEAALFLLAGVYGPSPIKGAAARLRALAKPIAVIACLVPVVGAVIYFSSFIPYASLGHSLSDIWAAQWSMLGYHSDMGYYTHPNASNWYEWPMTLSPLWFDTKNLPEGMLSTVSTMGNPVIWWVGLIAILVSIVDGVKLKWPHLFLGTLYVAQLLPYALISRYLFIYHYYAEVPIIALATAGLVHEMWYKPKQGRYILVLIAAAAVFFAVFYPVISGQIIPEWYSGYLHWFRDWRF